MSPTGRVPCACQSREVPRVVREYSPVLPRRKGKLEFVRCSQMTCFSGRQAVNTVLAEHYREDD